MSDPPKINDLTTVTVSNRVNYIERKPFTPLKDVTIMINPGHGCIKNSGIDDGAKAKLKGKIVLEKDLNDQIAQDVKRKLERLGATIIYVDNAPVGKIRDLKSEHKPDMFISIHHDALNSKSEGETIYGWGEKGSIFRDTVNDFFAQDTTIKNKNSDKKTLEFIESHAQKLAVLKTDPEIPAILVEVGYMSNPKELKKITTREYQDKAAQFIVDGARQYAKTIKKEKEEVKVVPKWDLINQPKKELFNKFGIINPGEDI